jgi:hypothetical protein
MTFHIDFETEVDEAGYELVPGGIAEPGDSETVLSVVFSTLQGKPVRPDRIVRRGGKLKIQRPFEKVTNLFKLFAKMAITPSGLLDFVNKFGPMLPTGNEFGEDILDGISAAQNISSLLRAYSEKRVDFVCLTRIIHRAA